MLYRRCWSHRLNPPAVMQSVARDSASWREWFAKPELQRGLGLAVLGPFLTCLGGIGVVMLRGLDPECGEAWAIVHIVAFGVLQLVWILPVAGIAMLRGSRGFACGLLVGAGVLLFSNGIAWIIGLWIGAS